MELLPDDWNEPDGGSSDRPSERQANGYVKDVLEALEAMDGDRLNGSLMRAAVALTSREFLDGVVVPLLYEAGDLWEDGHICPAHEHLLSAQLSRVLGWLSNSIWVPRGAPKALAATPAGQRHEFGALLGSIIGAEEGWSVTYLGADLPVQDIVTAVRVSGAKLVMLSVVMPQDAEEIVAVLRELRDSVGPHPRILVGGAAVAGLRDEIDASGATPLLDLAALRASLAVMDGGWSI
jgi:methanogenic corrinoid protein MtbC1